VVDSFLIGAGYGIVICLAIFGLLQLLGMM
jgi:hypothetical protein